QAPAEDHAAVAGLEHRPGLIPAATRSDVAQEGNMGRRNRHDEPPTGEAQTTSEYCVGRQLQARSWPEWCPNRTYSLMGQGTLRDTRGPAARLFTKEDFMNWMRNWFAPRRAKSTPATFRPRLEPLKDRQLLNASSVFDGAGHRVTFVVDDTNTLTRY